MKKVLLVSLVVVLGLLFSGWLFFSEFMSADSDSEPSSQNFTRKGTIVSMEEDSVLMVQGAEPEETKDESTKKLLEKYGDGIWFDRYDVQNAEALEPGMQVKVWFRAINTSMPAYGEAVRLQIL
ncbi:DUF3221 domain-containing protein [Salibacterium halotolerans]|uniref:DUF3221 domain-containing protein n=1 Tax=Salibacterium halotolerans TaxID=1884432 RepID=A0A1I5RS62_9BACI|nr:DUF3221 domain-containing protein [Salibacterium halotolerans]SFP60796.1 Protein of unknown function [Salibacterium halotolerans]